MFGERDMGNGTASAVTKTCRKSGQFIFPNVWLHIPTGKKKNLPLIKKTKKTTIPIKKSPELHSCFEDCKVYTSTSG